MVETFFLRILLFLSKWMKNYVLFINTEKEEEEIEEDDEEEEEEQEEYEPKKNSLPMFTTQYLFLKWQAKKNLWLAGCKE